MTTTYDPKLHKIVPIEPTLAMIKDGTECMTCAAEDVWQAMLSAAPSPWQDISTAPRDGTRVLVYIPKKYSRKGIHHPEWIGAIAIARWHVPTEEQMNKHKSILTGRHGGYWTSHHKGTQPIKGCPTKYMPLPTQPEN